MRRPTPLPQAPASGDTGEEDAPSTTADPIRFPNPVARASAPDGHVEGSEAAASGVARTSERSAGGFGTDG
ncbi:MAG: hypothetical protein DI577_01050, partial [Microbacterium sp.]